MSRSGRLTARRLAIILEQPPTEELINTIKRKRRKMSFTQLLAWLSERKARQHVRI